MRQQAGLFKALGDETRLRILLLLLRYGELCVCDLEAALAIPQSTVSRHLAILRNGGVAEGERRGVWMYYRTYEHDDLQAAVLACIKKYGAALEQHREDERRLAAFLSSKTASTCAP